MGTMEDPPEEEEVSATGGGGGGGGFTKAHEEEPPARMVPLTTRVTEKVGVRQPVVGMVKVTDLAHSPSTNVTLLVKVGPRVLQLAVTVTRDEPTAPS